MPGRRFLYHAHGSAIGGTITQPFQADINLNVATSLPIIGGYASAGTDDYQLNDVISFRSARTCVSGIETDDGAFNSVATCVVEGLNILHMITADRIVGRLSAKHVDGKPTEFVPLGSSFENLRIGGELVEVDLNHDVFLQNPTHAGLTKHFESGGKKKTTERVRYSWGAANEDVPAKLAKGMLMEPGAGWHKSNGVLHTSVVKQVRTVRTGNTAGELPYGYAIHVPHVGNVYLGEIFVSGDTKRLTMLRVELGSPYVGTLHAASPVGNGNWFP